MMSIFLTEELTRHTADSKTSDLVFFFCGAGDDNRNTAVNFLRGLVHQILKKRPQLIGHALAYFTPPERAKQTLSSLEALWLIFSKLVVDDRLGTIFCVLDGLDECEDETTRSLLRRILDLLNAQCSIKAESLFKLAIVSRDMPVLRGCTTVKLDPDNNQEIDSDISTFVRTRIKELYRIDGFEHIQESVQAALLERAEGTFLWVGFAMHELLRTRTCKQIRETLKSLPSGLSAIYGRMLLSIPPDQRDYARTLLKWVALAARPLKLPELAAAILLPKSLPQIEVEQATRDLVILCGPLLRTEKPREEPRKYGYPEDAKIVQSQQVSLIHQSARDYLLRSDRDGHAVLETVRFHKAIIHLQLVKRCLDCIEQRGLQHDEPCFFTDQTPHWTEHPLQIYAASHWPEHAKESSALATNLFKSHAFFQPKKKALRRTWWDFYSASLNGPYLYVSEPPLLHIACILALIPLIEVVLGEQHWRPRMHRRINGKHEESATPLHIAVRQSDLALLRLLLQKGANSGIRDDEGQTPLESACHRGDEAVVRLLLDKGAKPAPRSHDFDLLLHIAVKGRNQALVQLLLDMGARPTAQDSDNFSALHYAVIKESPAISKLLIDKGADVKAKAATGCTPLHLAGRTGQDGVKVMQLLLDCGADINARDQYGDTALFKAVANANLAQVQFLLDRGADMKIKDSYGQGVLYVAAKPGSGWQQEVFKKIARLLMERGADVEELNGETEAAAYRNCKRLLGERSDAWETYESTSDTE
jgi:ankyrin repeat protein